MAPVRFPRQRFARFVCGEAIAISGGKIVSIRGVDCMSEQRFFFFFAVFFSSPANGVELARGSIVFFLVPVELASFSFSIRSFRPRCCSFHPFSPLSDDVGTVAVFILCVSGQKTPRAWRFLLFLLRNPTR